MFLNKKKQRVTTSLYEATISRNRFTIEKQRRPERLEQSRLEFIDYGD